GRQTPRRAWAGRDRAERSAYVLVQLIEAHTDLARLASVGRPENARVLQLIDDAGSAAVPDAELSLEQRCGAALVLDADLGRFAEFLVAVPAGGCARRSGA